MIYLLRSWPEIPEKSLYSSNNQSLTFSLDKDLTSATVVRADGKSEFSVGQKITYPELLRVLLHDKHIMTL